MPIDWHRIGLAMLITGSTIVLGWMVGSSDLISLSARVIIFAAASAGLLSVLSTAEERVLAQRALASRSLAPLKGI